MSTRRHSTWAPHRSKHCARLFFRRYFRVISGFILAFTLSIDDFAVTIFTIGNQGLETLSTYIYADARKGGLTPELRPLSTIIFVTVLVLLIVINKRAERTKND